MKMVTFTRERNGKVATIQMPRVEKSDRTPEEWRAIALKRWGQFTTLPCKLASIHCVPPSLKRKFEATFKKGRERRTAVANMLEWALTHRAEATKHRAEYDL